MSFDIIEDPALAGVNYGIAIDLGEMSSPAVARHVLVVHEEWDDGGGMTLHHPGSCPRRDLDGRWDYDCAVAYEVEAVGLHAFFVHRDSEDEDYCEAERLDPGPYWIEPWSEYFPQTGEWDGGLRLVDDE